MQGSYDSCDPLMQSQVTAFLLQSDKAFLAQARPKQALHVTSSILSSLILGWNWSLYYPRGSPMAIALIGAILKRNASEQRWKLISEKLQKSHYHLHAPVKDWNYQHPTLNASIELR